jgi:alpha-tubulin suppressor-like RCC1 family protein
VYCWGDNAFGDIGCTNNIATPVPHTSPRLLIPSTATLKVEQVAVGIEGTCVRVTDNGAKKVMCFGNAAWGILGDGTPQQGDKGCQTSTVTNVGSLGVGALTTADFAMCMRDLNSEFFCWGMNYVYFNVGLLDPSDNAQVFVSPKKLGFLGQSASAVSIGWLHTCALGRNDGSVTCWGGSSHYETGAKKDVAFPTQIVLPGTATQIAAHRQFTCALMTAGQVLCWGNNETQVIGPTNQVGANAASPTPIVWP